MKKIKYILFTAVILSFLFITACSTTKSVPQDDVYYSTSPHNNVTAKTAPSNAQQQKTKQTANTGYQQGKVENISQSSGQATSGDQYDVDYSARLKRFHQSNDTSLDYYDNYYADRAAQDSSKQTTTTTVVTSPSVSLNLGFGSSYFGSSWSFGFGYGGWGMGFGYGWGYPYYGWGGYYPPYYGYYPPYYGYYPPYYGYYPPYYPGWGGGYYPPYYPGYPDYGYRAGVYQPRVNRGGGSSVPRGTVAGGSGVYTHPGTKSAARNTNVSGTVSRKRVPVNPEGRNGKMVKPDGNYSRPAGSMRFNSALVKKRSEEIHAQGKLSKPGGNAVRKNPEGNRSSRFGVSEARNKGAESFRKPPAYQREANMPKPRFRKPKQYQSLESRSTRSSKEFYRAPARPSNPEYRRTGSRSIRVQPQTVRRQNIYRPVNTRNSVYRSNSRPRSGIKVYNTPTRSFSSPNSFRAPARRNSSVTRPTRSFSAPKRTFSAPVRTNTGSGGGGGGVRRSSGSGGIRH